MVQITKNSFTRHERNCEIAVFEIERPPAFTFTVSIEGASWFPLISCKSAENAKSAADDYLDDRLAEFVSTP